MGKSDDEKVEKAKKEIAAAKRGVEGVIKKVETGAPPADIITGLEAVLRHVSSIPDHHK